MRNLVLASMSVLMIAPLAVRAEDAAAAPAPAAVAPPRENPHLGAAQRLYQKLDLDAALAELQQAEATASEDDTVQILVYRGLVFADQGRINEAGDQFKRALAIRPWAEVPQDTSPRIAKTFSDARKSLWGSNIKPPKKRDAPAQQAIPASAIQGAQPQAVPATTAQADAASSAQAAPAEPAPKAPVTPDAPQAATPPK
jgi:tetratricopeptide (TPR) repeat protein